MEPPVKPDDADCCNSGCNPCILDVYEEQLKMHHRDSSKPLISNYKNCLSEASYSVFELIKITPHTLDTNLYTFEYKRPYKEIQAISQDNLCIMCKPGQHLLLRGSFADSQFTRAYTPIPVEVPNNLCFVVLVKLYDEGVMSGYLKSLHVHSETLWRGPYGNFELQYNFKHILLIGQGTGLAPLYSIINEMLHNEDCDTFLKLFFCCRSSKDILLRDDLYKFCAHWNFSYEVFVSQQADVRDIKYNEVVHSKKLQKESLRDFLTGKLGNSTQILVCGSDDFNRSMSGIFIELDFKTDNIFVF